MVRKEGSKYIIFASRPSGWLQNSEACILHSVQGGSSIDLKGLISIPCSKDEVIEKVIDTMKTRNIRFSHSQSYPIVLRKAKVET
jgi:hypothetical protein